MKKLIVLALLLPIFLFAKSGKAIAEELGLKAGSKAIKQWERVFQKKRKMKRLGIDKLSESDKSSLKEYLISHAADADAPEAAGI